MTNINEIIAQGGPRALQESLRAAQVLSSKNELILVETFKELDQEAKDDDSMRERYGSRWIRPTSASLTASLLEDAKMQWGKLERTRKSDHRLKESVQEVLTTWGSPLQVLSSGRVRFVPFTLVDERCGIPHALLVWNLTIDIQ